MRTRTMIAIATLLVLALAGAGCARKSSTAPGSALTPGVSVDVGVQAKTDTGVEVPIRVEDSTGGTVTITDQGTAPKDEGAKVPEGWKVYENEKFSIAIAYPSGWHYRERTQEEAGDLNRTIVDFDSVPIVASESEAHHPLSLSLYSGSLKDTLQVYEDIPGAKKEIIMVGGREYHRITSQTEYGGETFSTTVHLTAYNGNVYELSGDTGLPKLQQVVQTIQIGGAP